jgi:hypothetical protein
VAADELVRLRRWVLVTGALLAVVVVLSALVVEGALEALYRRDAFGPLDFSQVKKIPRRPLEQTLQKADWIAAGVALNLLVSWGLAAALLCPKALTTQVLPGLARRRNAGIAIGFAAAAVGLHRFSFASAAHVAWIPVVFSGLVVTGASLGRFAGPAGFGALVTGAAVATLAVIYVPPLFTDPKPLDLLFAEDMAFEMLQAQLFVFSGLLLLRTRRPAEGWKRRVLLLGALGFFFVAGEEVSWGQRFVGWGTPEFWANTQDETNVHNMPALDRWMNLRPGLYAWVAVSILARLAPRVKRALDELGIPVVPHVGWLAVAAAMLAHNRELHRWYRNTDEAQETFAAIAFTTATVAAYYASVGTGARAGEARSAGGAPLSAAPIGRPS